MKCPNCGTVAPDNANFCASCGLTLDTGERKRGPSKPNLPLVMVLTAIGVFILLAIVFALLRPKPGPQAIVQSPTPTPGGRSVVQSPVAPTPGQSVAQANVPPPPEMPKAPPREQAPREVLDYIEFVSQAEAKRKEMRVDFTPALDMMKSAYGAQLGFDENTEQPTPPKVKQGYSKYTQDWNRLVQIFDSKQAPEPCRPLAGAYRQALGTYVVTMTRIQAALVQNDLNSLMAMRSKAQPDLDKMLVDADGELTKLNDRYKLKKTFEITPDKEVETIFGR